MFAGGRGGLITAVTYCFSLIEKHLACKPLYFMGWAEERGVKVLASATGVTVSPRCVSGNKIFYSTSTVFYLTFASQN